MMPTKDERNLITQAFAWRLEWSGVRTAMAAVLPLFFGQILHQPSLGLLIGLGGLYVSLLDKEGANARTLLIGCAGSAVAALAGTLAGTTPWLAIPLMFVVALGGGLSALRGSVASQLGFVMTLVFAVSLGMPGAFYPVGVQRMAAFALGGLWATLLTLLLWRIQPRLPVPDAALDRPALVAHALRLGIAATVAVALFELLRIEHGYWMILTVLVVLKPDLPSTRTRAIERMAGSAIGGLAAVALAMFVRNILILDALLALLSVLAYSQVRYHYGLFVALLTPFIVLMINTVNPGDWQIALVRIADTLAGGALALAVAYLLRLQGKQTAPVS